MNIKYDNALKKVLRNITKGNLLHFSVPNMKFPAVLFISGSNSSKSLSRKTILIFPIETITI